MRHVPPKRRLTLNITHGVISQKAEFITTAVSISNPKLFRKLSVVPFSGKIIKTYYAESIRWSYSLSGIGFRFGTKPGHKVLKGINNLEDCTWKDNIKIDLKNRMRGCGLDSSSSGLGTVAGL
jgi:hypothetical protein